MAYSLLSCDREQGYLMAPSLRDWLPEGDLACFILDAVEQIDLGEFYAVYRNDGWGAAAYDPGMMVGANAALAANRSHEAIEEEVRRILAEARAVDAEEDTRFCPDQRGAELPAGLGRRAERLKHLQEAKTRLEERLQRRRGQLRRSWRSERWRRPPGRRSVAWRQRQAERNLGSQVYGTTS